MQQLPMAADCPSLTSHNLCVGHCGCELCRLTATVRRPLRDDLTAEIPTDLQVKQAVRQLLLQALADSLSKIRSLAVAWGGGGRIHRADRPL